MEPGAHDRLRRVGVGLAALTLFLGFVALGAWQLQRRAWKHDLIERVEQRVHAPAVAAPLRGDWPGRSLARDEYRRVSLTGRFLAGRETLVQASTELGAGYWVMTPLQAADGSVVLVNRGFVPPGTRGRPPVAAASGGETVTVTGLLRLPEPGGGFLRQNAPAADRWYSRDVQAIAAAHGLGAVAPYFIDAEADVAASTAPSAPSGEPAAAAQPVGGLTVVRFSDHHLVYALTWFALAGMVVAAAVVLGRQRHGVHAGAA